MADEQGVKWRNYRKIQIELLKHQLVSMLEFFKQNGFILKSEIDVVFWTKVSRALEVLPRLYEDDQVKKIWRSPNGSPKHLVAPHLRYLEFRDLIFSQEILEFVRLMWPKDRAYLYNSKVSLKRLGEKQLWAPHQDSAYKPRKVQGITICIFLVDCSANSGTLQVFPKSHEYGKLEHKLIQAGECEYQLVVKHLPKIKPLTVTANAGSILFMSSHMIHQSQANQDLGDRPIFIFEIERFAGWAIDEYKQLPLMLQGKMTRTECWRSHLTYSLKPDVLIAQTKSLARQALKRI